MKKIIKCFFAILKRPFLFILILSLGSFAYYKVADYKWSLLGFLDLLKENDELKVAVKNLTSYECVAYIDCIKRIENKRGVTVELNFIEMDRKNEKKKIREEKGILAKGELTYFSALVVSFDQARVESGEKKALFLWKTIFGGRESPELDGYPLDESIQPDAYEEISVALYPNKLIYEIHDFWDKLSGSESRSEKFWSEIWNFASNPDRLKTLGVQSIQTKSSGMKLKEGMRYKLTIGSSGKMDISVVGPFDAYV